MEQIIIKNTEEALAFRLEAEDEAFKEAEKLAAFDQYRFTKSDGTKKTHRLNLRFFATYLVEKHHANISIDDLYFQPEAWANVNYSRVKAWEYWMAEQGYSLATIQNALSTIKRYAKIACMDADIIGTETFLMIKATDFIAGSKNELKEFDKNRKKQGMSTRRDTAKKGHVTRLTPKMISILIWGFNLNEPRGRRNHLIILLLAKLGIRAGEVIGLKVEDVNLERQTVKVYRDKTETTETLSLVVNTPDGPDFTLLEAMKSYIEKDAFDSGPLLRKSSKSGYLGRPGITGIALAKLIRSFGDNMLGVDRLSPHDFRHYWADSTEMAGTTDEAAQMGGGWKTPAMLKYYRSQNEEKIKNADVILESTPKNF